MFLDSEVADFLLEITACRSLLQKYGGIFEKIKDSLMFRMQAI